MDQTQLDEIKNKTDQLEDHITGEQYKLALEVVHKIKAFKEATSEDGTFENYKDEVTQITRVLLAKLGMTSQEIEKALP